MARHYQTAEVEAKWQQYWEMNKTFKTREDPGKPKYYVLDMFPYPSGDGLHVGHPEGYTATDIISRARRMQGYNVLHPMGWDAFGLPTEQYAIKTGIPPKTISARNIATFRRQMKAIGFSYDWDREVSTADPSYYRWTQWIFLQLHKRGLAYVSEVPVNWCPALGTVLANEEVIDGKSERGNHPVVRLPMRQWVLKITAYADRLIDDLEGLDWPESIKEMQRNWIGRSIGAEAHFGVEGHPDLQITIFTTRSDTLFGATYMVLSPEHALVDTLTTSEHKAAVDAYRAAAARKSELERTELSKEKTGVFTGAFALNPVNGKPIPIWIADYVLAGYGTGAIMAVPGHDQRDYEFATRFELPIQEVVQGGDLSKEAFTGNGLHVNSGFLDGLDVPTAIDTMNTWLESQRLGRKKVSYRLRDWVFSRQRYWGEPFPVIFLEDGTQRTVPESELPVLLPEVESIKPTGTAASPLAAVSEWVNTRDPETGAKAKRETDTMPNWAGSCWYYLRFIDPHNTHAAVGKDKEQYWMPVDLYVGGAEHAVLHLLYARFWHKVLYDLGYVSTVEPFQKLRNQGLILGEDGEKMSKSRGNVINPDAIIAQFGADTLRVYEMFMGPLEVVKPWDTRGTEGIYRFLLRVWRLVDDWVEKATPGSEETLRRIRHQTIKKVTHDIENMRFNTAISQIMVYVNELYKAQPSQEDLETVALLLSPFAPHLGEECWNRLGHSESLAYAPWPPYVEAYTIEDLLTIAIQVNGKLRGQVEISMGAAPADVLTAAREQVNVVRYLEGKTLLKEIYVPNKLVSFVVK